MSNHPGMAIPPFKVIGITGAFGKIHLTFLISPNEDWLGMSDHPLPVSPKPCKKMIALSHADPVSTTNGGGELYSLNRDAPAAAAAAAAAEEEDMATNR